MNYETPTKVAVLHFPALRPSPLGCLCVRLSAVETSGVSGRQMSQPY
jgi:hypothetical protein